jgi:hypothetical protein
LATSAVLKKNLPKVHDRPMYEHLANRVALIITKKQPSYRFPIVFESTFERPFCILNGILDQDVGLEIKVARWFVFKPKMPIWVNFDGP